MEGKNISEKIRYLTGVLSGDIKITNKPARNFEWSDYDQRYFWDLLIINNSTKCVEGQ